MVEPREHPLAQRQVLLGAAPGRFRRAPHHAGLLHDLTGLELLRREVHLQAAGRGVPGVEALAPCCANLADRQVEDFQDWPPRRPLVVATAVELVRCTGEHLVCPQSLLDPRRMRDLRTGLEDAGLLVRPVLLDASASALRDRIHDSGEAVAWHLTHVGAYERARPHRDGGRGCPRATREGAGWWALRRVVR